MSRFNAPTSSTRTENFAGGESFAETPKLEFISILLTSFVKDQFYRSEDEGIERINTLLKQIDPLFAAKAAIYARTKFGMRSISHVVAGEIARLVKGKEWTKKFFNKVIFRPDDMSEILSYYYAKNGVGKEPNSLKKGFALALQRFNEYQLAKYKGEGKDVSLTDIVNLVHPKNTEAISKLIKGTLAIPQTWEAKMTQVGQKAKTEEEKEEMKKDVWKTLVAEKKIGYFALLRNLRNILEQAPEIVPQALEMLIDEHLIKGSLVLPFRFATAIKEIESLSGTNTKLNRDTLIALNKAVEISLSNVPKFNGSTLVVLDTSGSMEGKPVEIGALFSVVLVKSNNADFMYFSDYATYMNLNPMDSILTLTKKIENDCETGGTNFQAIFDTANKPYNRIVILSDCQGWIGYDAPTKQFSAYKKRTGANPKVYSFDLAGYGSLQLPENNIFCLAGFSEKTFDIIKMLEQDKNAFIAEIEKIEI